MAGYNHGQTLPMKAASAIAQWVPVMPLAGASSVDHTVIRAGSLNDLPIGMTIATIASVGDPVTVVVGGIAKGIAGASLGAGAPVGVGSTNGVLIPQTPSVTATAMALRWVVGVSLDAAAAGDVFSIWVKPDQLV